MVHGATSTQRRRTSPCFPSRIRTALAGSTRSVATMSKPGHTICEWSRVMSSSIGSRNARRFTSTSLVSPPSPDPSAPPLNQVSAWHPVATAVPWGAAVRARHLHGPRQHQQHLFGRLFPFW